jgi:hypothetical protein
LFAQDVTTVTARSEDISDNLDLEAVASVFGESKDLEDFEKRLNGPDTQISNLDLNNDGEVDYLRVMETADGNVHQGRHRNLHLGQQQDKPQDLLAVLIQDQVVEHLALLQDRHHLDPVLEEQDINN